eukprot:Colp12_sorted_trinity150504_noHs@4809
MLPQRFLQVLFEVLFTLTSDNHVHEFMGPFKLLATFLQIQSFVYHPRLEAWGLPTFQEGLAYVLFPWDVTAVFWLVIGLIGLYVLLVCVICFQVYDRGGVSSIGALRLLRWLTGLFTSVLFIPMIEQMLGPLHEIYEHGNLNISKVSAGSAGFCLFYILIMTTFYLSFNPNPKTKSIFERSR